MNLRPHFSQIPQAFPQSHKISTRKLANCVRRGNIYSSDAMPVSAIVLRTSLKGFSQGSTLHICLPTSCCSRTGPWFVPDSQALWRAMKISSHLLGRRTTGLGLSDFLSWFECTSLTGMSQVDAGFLPLCPLRWQQCHYWPHPHLIILSLALLLCSGVRVDDKYQGGECETRIWALNVHLDFGCHCS